MLKNEARNLEGLEIGAPDAHREIEDAEKEAK